MMCFQKKWTDDYFFVEVKGRPVCLVCGDSLAVMIKTNLGRCYSTTHARLSELQGQLRKDKLNALKQGLGAQQAAFTRPYSERENVVQASYVVSELFKKIVLKCGPRNK